jgi:hypothetical protein
MGDPHAATQPLLTEVVCLATTLLVLCLSDPWRVWVAEHDRAQAVVIPCYIGLYLCRHAFDLAMDNYVYTFNVITATLLLVTARVYLSFETPYATVFFVLLLTRFFHKLQAPAPNPIERLTMAADALVIALHYRLSYRPSFWDPQNAAVYASAIVFLCYIVGLMTSEQILAEAPPQGQDVGVRASAGARLLHAHHGQPPTHGAHGGKAGHNALRLQLLYR